MARRRTGLELQVRSAFEAARIAPQCLAEAYKRLVPILNRPTRPAACSQDLPDLMAVPERPRQRRAEGG